MPYIQAIKVRSQDLNFGDLFSTADQTYWDLVNKNIHHSIGEKVFIRTLEPCPKDQEDEDIYRLTVYQY